MDTGAPAFIGGFEERVIATIDGLALYARDYAPLEPANGLPVICLHGLTRNSRDFEIVAPRIAALGRRVVCPDMRGRGKSANDPDPAHYVPAVYAQDVIAVMDKLSIPKAVFIGGRLPSDLVDRLADHLNQRLRKRAGDVPAIAPVLRAAMAADAPAIGAAILPFNELLLPSRAALMKAALD